MEIKKVKIMEIIDFEREINKKLVVREREDPSKGVEKYYANFVGCEVSKGHLLCGVYGDGNTPFKAIKDYAKQISGKRLVFNAFSSSRREIKAPKLIHTGRKK